MNLTKAQRKQWSDALRSGDFKQCQFTIKRFFDDGVSYCCLGVAYEVWHGPELPKTSECRYGFVKAIITQRTMFDFMALNDEFGKTFPEIADVVDQLPTID